MDMGKTIKHVMALIPVYPEEVRLSWIRKKYHVLDSAFPIYAPLCEFEGGVCYPNDKAKQRYMKEIGVKSWKKAEEEARNEMPRMRKRAHAHRGQGV